MSPNQATPSSTDHNNSSFKQQNRSRIATTYWRANLLVVGILLSVWFLVGYVISIFFIDKVNLLSIGKLPLGFWFAQQGSILVFVVLVWLYAILMDGVDQKFQRDSERD